MVYVSQLMRINCDTYIIIAIFYLSHCWGGGKGGDGGFYTHKHQHLCIANDAWLDFYQTRRYTWAQNQSQSIFFGQVPSW